MKLKGIKGIKKKWLVIAVLAVVVLGGGAFWAVRHFKAVPQTSSTITAVVGKGDVKQEITATGTVKYPQEVPLAFEQAGTVKEVYVQAGDKVTAGQILAQMETETLQQEVTESQANLKEAELSWQQQFTEAQGAIVKSKQALRTAEQNADPAYLANQLFIAEQNVTNAGNNLAKAQQGGDTSNIQQAQSSLAQAQSNLLTVQNNVNGGAAQAVESAKSDLAIAEAKLTRLQEKTSLAQAQTAVVKAQENLTKATLVSPADGVLLDIAVKEGQTVNASTTAMNLATGGDHFIIDAVVSQVEIADIKTGQKVNVTLDSDPDKILAATVSNVALKGTTTQSVTTFTVTMQMNEATDLLRAGMNANVAIIVAEAKDVLTVPSQAIRTQGNQKGVLVIETAGTENSAQENPGQSRPGRSQQDGTAEQNGNQSGSGTQGGANNTPPAGSGTAPGAGQNGQGNRPQNAGAQNWRAQAGGAAGAGSTDGTTTRFVPVETGLDDGTNVEIKSGLTEGQIVVAGTRSTGTGTNSNTNANSRTNPGVVPGMGGAGGGFGGSTTIRMR